MKSLQSATSCRVVIRFLLLAHAGFFPAVGANYSVTLPAASAWFDTGIDVSVGQVLEISASGTVRYSTGGPETNPDGVNSAVDGTQKPPPGRPFIVTGAIAYSLVGKIGGTGTVGTGTLLPEFVSGKGEGFVGSFYQHTVGATGRLFLACNDEYFSDNSGGFSVTVTTTGVVDGAVGIQFVTVADPGNPPDSTGYGRVDYVYRIGKYEVTCAQYAEFLNAKAKNDPLGLFNLAMETDPRGGIIRTGNAGSFVYSVKNGYANRPIVFVSFYDALRFCNWLYNGAADSSDTETGAYSLNGSNPQGVTRHPQAEIFLPSEDEWYKAAYYQPPSAGGPATGYWLYPTRSNIAPTGEAPPGGVNSANYRWNIFSGNLSDVGAYRQSASYYGTFDQAGNAWERTELIVGGSRGLRGGSWGDGNTDPLNATYRFGYLDPNEKGIHKGFRVAAKAAMGGPSISVQPQSLVVLPGNSATFSVSVVADSGESPAYQWQFNGDDLPRETNSTLVISGVAAANLGAYKVVVFNSAGSVTSEPAFLSFPDLARGLVAYYPFNDNVNDESGNGIQGIANNVSFASDRFGARDRAVSFAGHSNSNIKINSTKLNLLPEFSVSVWIKYTAGGTEGPRIISTSGYEITTENASVANNRHINFNNTFSPGAGFTNINSSTGVSAGVWTHVVGVRVHNQLKLYVNGTLNNSISTTLLPDYSRGFVPEVGGNSGNDFDNYAGLVDDLRVYERALSDLEIELLYNSPPRLPVLLQQPASASVLEEADVSFHVDADGTPPLSYQWQRNGENLVGQTNSTLDLFDVSPNEAGAYKVVVSNAAGMTTSEAAILTVTPVLTLPIALDTATLYWRSGGHRAWLPQGNVTRDGADSAQSGSVLHSQNSWIETTVAGPGTLTFWWRVSSEPGFDTFRFFVTETLEASISGEVDWQLKNFNIPAGLQTLRWVYSKDGSSSMGQDRAWLDQVAYTPAPGVAQPFYVVAKRRFPDGRFKLTCFGPADRRYTVEASSNLADWTSLVTLTNALGTVQFVDTDAVWVPHRFYRALEAP